MIFFSKRNNKQKKTSPKKRVLFSDLSKKEQEKILKEGAKRFSDRFSETIKRLYGE